MIKQSFVCRSIGLIPILHSLDVVPNFKKGGERRRKTAKNSIPLPFPQSHLISRKYNQTGVLPTATSAKRIVQLFLGISLPAESFQTSMSR